jgi:hypothetical protein
VSACFAARMDQVLAGLARLLGTDEIASSL